MARPGRLELPTLGFEDRYSILLSYGRLQRLLARPRAGLKLRFPEIWRLNAIDAVAQVKSARLGARSPYTCHYVSPEPATNAARVGAKLFGVKCAQHSLFDRHNDTLIDNIESERQSQSGP